MSGVLPVTGMGTAEALVGPKHAAPGQEHTQLDSATREGMLVWNPTSTTQSAYVPLLG